MSSIEKADLSSGKEIELPKIEIQMPTPVCENKSFDHHHHHHHHQQQQQQKVHLSTAGGRPEDDLPTIMVEGATPVATPVLEHKVRLPSNVIF